MLELLGKTSSLHSDVVMMMMPLLLGVMLGVVLAAPVRRVRVVDDVDAEARRLASPDLDDAALGDSQLLLATLFSILSSLSSMLTVKATQWCGTSFTVVPIGVTVVAGSNFTKAACSSRASIFVGPNICGIWRSNGELILVETQALLFAFEFAGRRTSHYLQQDFSAKLSRPRGVKLASNGILKGERRNHNFDLIPSILTSIEILEAPWQI
ncbi:hypothetical protein EAI_12172 [Harpegnathos saltator]|uniref:Uncharacterized protein n=1 Tax=Harpegnathos saltator TaxID=610380 RepID=E2BZB0_HARSA|nr:hypothetical protein EAI_12172 [Harpegnathos saltator]